MSEPPFEGVVFAFVWTALFFIGYLIGIPILRTVTLGRYPTNPPSPTQRLAMLAVGNLVLFVVLVAARNLIWP